MTSVHLVRSHLLIIVSCFMLSAAFAASAAADSSADWCDLGELQAKYQEAKGADEGAYRHQYLCMLEKVCVEFLENGQAGWADGFVRSTFSYQTRNGVPGSVDLTCPDAYSAVQCFKAAGGVHGMCELGPSFFAYCDEIPGLGEPGHSSAVEDWTSDHELFLEKAFEPCFEEILAEGELPREEGGELREAYRSLARMIRENAQASCGAGFFGKAAFDRAVAWVIEIILEINEGVMCRNK